MHRGKKRGRADGGVGGSDVDVQGSPEGRDEEVAGFTTEGIVEKFQQWFLDGGEDMETLVEGFYGSNEVLFDLPESQHRQKYQEQHKRFGQVVSEKIEVFLASNGLSFVTLVEAMEAQQQEEADAFCAMDPQGVFLATTDYPTFLLMLEEVKTRFTWGDKVEDDLAEDSGDDNNQASAKSPLPALETP
jgi:hypothetical protein